MMENKTSQSLHGGRAAGIITGMSTGTSCNIVKCPYREGVRTYSVLEPEPAPAKKGGSGSDFRYFNI